MIRATLAGLAFAAAPAAAEPPDLAWPDQSRLSFERTDPSTRHQIATGPFADDRLPTKVIDGVRRVEVHRTPHPIEPLEAITALKVQLAALGYVAGFDCDAHTCGGFDFRYALDITHEPEMHVDLGNFHYLSLASPATGARATLLVSSSVSEGFVEFTHIETPDAPRPAAAPEPTSTRDTTLPVAQQLERFGSAALDDLEFATGSSALEANSATSLSQLADFLDANPGATMILVGHTDAAGSLEGNIGLSLKRAGAVRDALVSDHGVSADRLRAEGIGYLAPRATNDSDDGRKRNRRVEAVLEARE